MNHNVTAAGAGLVFAIGLGVARMTDPGKVIAFLDVTGDWDPSLALVMAGGIAAHVLLYRFILARPAPLVEREFRIPTRRDLTPNLVLGSALFGIGWGVAGFCPGPALTSLVTGNVQVLAFVAAMTMGMLGHDKLLAWRSARETASSPLQQGQSGHA